MVSSRSAKAIERDPVSKQDYRAQHITPDLDSGEQDVKAIWKSVGQTAGRPYRKGVVQKVKTQKCQLRQRVKEM